MANPDNTPQLPKNQSAISTNGVVSRDWYRFFLNLLNKVNEGGGGGNGTGTVTSVNVSGGATGLTTSGGPITTNGTITLNGTVNIAHGGTGATTAAGARTNLGAAASGANSDITSMSGVIGGISTPDNIQFDTAATAAIGLGNLRWNTTTNTLAFGIIDGTDEVNIGEQMYAYVRNADSVTITRGQPVYLFGAQGNRASVKLAANTGDATSAKTLGLAAQDITSATDGFVITQGVLDKVDTSAFAEGATLYLGATAGTLTDTKPQAPNHLVYIGVVERSNAGNGQIYVRPQNGYELDEIHDVKIVNPVSGNTLIYDGNQSLWVNANLTGNTGVSVTNGNGSITLTNTGVTSLTGTASQVNVSASTGAVTLSLPSTINVNTTGTAGNVTGVVAVANGGTGLSTTPANGELDIGNGSGFTRARLTGGSNIVIVNTPGGISISAPNAGVGIVTATSPVVSSGGSNPDISLASGYGDTQNPYASKTANYFLAAPNGTAGVPTFRAVVAADIPTLNQNTTGQAGSVANALTAGTGISYSAGTTYNGSAAITINNSAPMVYPGAGIPNSTGTAWGASYTTTGSGTVLALATSPSFTTPILGTPQSGDFSIGTFTWPTFNQNTTGTAGNVTGVVAIANGGTGQTTANPAFNALAPTTTKGDLIVSNGTANVRQAVGIDTYVLTANSSAATGVSWLPASGSGATITNDTTTATNVYPTFAAATSGSLSTIYTSNAKYLYKPSTGELTSPEVVASNGMFVNNQTISTNYTIPAGSTAISGGPITVASGVAVTVSSGARWVTI